MAEERGKRASERTRVLMPGNRVVIVAEGDLIPPEGKVLGKAPVQNDLDRFRVRTTDVAAPRARTRKPSARRKPAARKSKPKASDAAAE